MNLLYPISFNIILVILGLPLNNFEAQKSFECVNCLQFAVANELFECVWPFCELVLKGLNLWIQTILMMRFAVMATFPIFIYHLGSVLNWWITYLFQFINRWLLCFVFSYTWHFILYTYTWYLLIIVDTCESSSNLSWSCQIFCLLSISRDQEY